MEPKEAIEYLLEVDQQRQRLDRLIRQGMLPARQLPILHRALANMKAGKLLPPYEREAISKLVDKMMNFQFGDDITYNRARLHTQKTKYQTEEKKMKNGKEGDVVVYDGSEDEAEAKKKQKNGKSILKSNKGDGINKDEEMYEYYDRGHGEDPNDATPQAELERERSKRLKAMMKKKPQKMEKPMKEEMAMGNRPADAGHNEGDLNKKPKQGGSKENPEVGELAPKQDGKPDIKEGLLSDLDAEGKRTRDARRFKRAGRRAKDEILKGMPSSLRREKMKNESTLPTDLQKFNELYKKNLETALANRGVDNVRDLPENMKESMFKKVDEASYSNKQIKMAKGIAFDKRYKGGNMTGAAKQMEKIKKGLSDHPAVSDALRQANEEKMASKDHDGDGKIESGKDEYMGSRDKAIKKAMAMRKGKKLQDSVIDVMLGREPLPEGAKEDAMRDMKTSQNTKGMASTKKDPKPGKSKHDGSENKGPAHIVSQLRGVLDQGDKHAGVKFQDGKTAKVGVKDAHKFLNKYMSGKPADKMKMQAHGHASHDNFKTHLD